MKYTKQLTKKLIDYIYRRNNIKVSNQQAEQYLDSLADLVLCLSKNNKEIK